jgi:hypothetical protein
MAMKKGILLILTALTIGSTSPAFADATNDDLKAEINALKTRLAQLEAKVAEQPQTQMAGMDTAPAVTVPSLIQGVGLSGYVDSIYSYNFNSPDTLTNRARVFDRHPNSFNINAAELVFQKPVSADSRVGYRTDLFFGNDSEVITSGGLGSAADEFDLQQGFVEILVPTSNAIPGLNDIDLKLGKFVTMNGAEVIESKDNWNTSRSLLFGYAIPFTHTGVRGTYTFNNGWDLALGVVNGWDVTDDTNNGKTIETHFGFNNIALPGDSFLTVALQGYFGPEQAGDDSSSRNLFDMVVIYKTPWKPLTLMYNYDYATEEDLIFSPSTNAITDNANWDGHAFYARYDINDQWSLSGRYEYFNDDDGVRVLAGTPADYQEITGTLEYRPWKNLVTRLEYRYDDANRNVFFDHSASGFSDNQSTISGEVMFIF